MNREWQQFLFGTPRRTCTTVLIASVLITILAGIITPGFIHWITGRLLAAFASLINTLINLILWALILGFGWLFLWKKVISKPKKS